MKLMQFVSALKDEQSILIVRHAYENLNTYLDAIANTTSYALFDGTRWQCLLNT